MEDDHTSIDRAVRQMNRKSWSIPRYALAVATALLVCGCRTETSPIDLGEDSEQGSMQVMTASERVADQPNRLAKQAFLKASTSPGFAPVPSDIVLVKAVKKGSAIKSEPPLLPVRHTKMRMIEFQNGP